MSDRGHRSRTTIVDQDILHITDAHTGDVAESSFKADCPSRDPRYFLSEFQGKFMYWSRVS
jgi:hypothetical protein